MAVSKLVRLRAHAVGLSADDDDQLERDFIIIWRLIAFCQSAAHFKLVVGDCRKGYFVIFVQQIFLEIRVVAVAALLKQTYKLEWVINNKVF